MPLLERSARETADLQCVGARALVTMAALLRQRESPRFQRAVVAFLVLISALQMPRRSWAAPPDDVILRSLRPTWSLENMLRDNMARSLTRFPIEDLPALAAALRIPELYDVRQEHTVHRIALSGLVGERQGADGGHLWGKKI